MEKSDIWTLSPSLWPWPTNRKIYCQKLALEGLYHTISCLSLYSPGAHNIINWIPKIMVQFSTLSHPSLPSLTFYGPPTRAHKVLRYTYLDYHPHLHPPDSSRESMIRCSYWITEKIKHGWGGTYRDLDWRRGSLVQLKHFQASRSVNNALHIHGR